MEQTAESGLCCHPSSRSGFGFFFFFNVISCSYLLNRHVMKHCVNCHLFKDIWEQHEPADIMLFYGN